MNVRDSISGRIILGRTRNGGPSGFPFPGADGATGAPGQDGSDGDASAGEFMGSVFGGGLATVPGIRSVGVTNAPALDGEEGAAGQDGTPTGFASFTPSLARVMGNVAGMPGMDGEDGYEPTPMPGVQGMRGLQGIPGAPGLDAEENTGELNTPVAFAPWNAAFYGPVHQFAGLGLVNTTTFGADDAGAGTQTTVDIRGGSTVGRLRFYTATIHALEINANAGFGTPYIKYNTLLTFNEMTAGVNVLQLTTAAGGGISAYRGLATVSTGIPAIHGQINLTGQTATLGGGSATANALLYAVPAGETRMYRISWYLKVTTAGSVSSTLGGIGFKYTDGTDSVAQAIVAGGNTQAGLYATTNAGNNTTTVLSNSTIIYALASTNITYGVTYVANAAASMAYEVHIRVEAL